MFHNEARLAWAMEAAIIAVSASEVTASETLRTGPVVEMESARDWLLSLSTAIALRPALSRLACSTPPSRLDALNGARAEPADLAVDVNQCA